MERKSKKAITRDRGMYCSSPETNAAREWVSILDVCPPYKLYIGKGLNHSESLQAEWLQRCRIVCIELRSQKRLLISGAY